MCTSGAKGGSGGGATQTQNAKVTDTTTSNDINTKIAGDTNLHGLGNITHPATMKNQSEQALLHK
jgi:hypothetical protein